MQNIVQKIDSMKDSFSKTERGVADYICANPEKSAIYSIQDLADATHASEASIIRFAKKLGFKGYQELRSQLKERLSDSFSTSKRLSAFCQKGDSTRCIDFISCQIAYMEGIKNLVRMESFSILIDTLSRAHTVYLYEDGGASRAPGSTLEFWLQRFGYDVRRIASSGHRLFDRLVYAGKDDVLIAFCFGKDNESLNRVLKCMNEQGVPSFLITDYLIGVTASLAGHVFALERGAVEVVHSMSIPILFSECLVLEIANRRHEDIAPTLSRLDVLRNQFDV